MKGSSFQAASLVPFALKDRGRLPTTAAPGGLDALSEPRMEGRRWKEEALQPRASCPRLTVECLWGGPLLFALLSEWLCSLCRRENKQ